MPPKRKNGTRKSPGRPAKKSRNTKSASISPSRPSSHSPNAQDIDPNNYTHHPSNNAESHTIALRNFYPPEMSNERAIAYMTGDIPRPYDQLKKQLDERRRQQEKFEKGSSVVMWFRTDLRMNDNRALEQASQLAHEMNIPIIGLYIASPQDYKAHLKSSAKIDFIYRHLKCLRERLADLDIPLHVEEVPNRRDVPAKIRDLVSEWKARNVFANFEYEVDELRRDRKVLDTLHDVRVSFRLCHDTCIVEPGVLKSGSGNQYSVYSPWYRAWCRYVGDNRNCIRISERPSKNPPVTREQFASLFDCEIPELEIGECWNKNYKDTIYSLWPAGEDAAEERLAKFCESKITKYGDKRDLPAQAATSSLSPYLAVGSISPRTCIKAAEDQNTTRKIGAGSTGIQTWISEVAWRDFYRHILAHWPHVCMNKSFKLEYSNIEWSYNEENFKAWCEGRTGFPIVDAAMRQLNQTGWMHNRCRMVVASFLCKDLLIDWRMGERYFMEHLIDGDLASNNGGWQWSASSGADPQPYFRIFNPLLQSEKYDPDGTYIRTWVPELKNIKGKMVHDPYGRGASTEAKKQGYPKPLVEHKAARDKALSVYKKGLGKS